MGEQVLVPDLGGWRRETLPSLDGGSYRLVVTHAGEAPVRAELFDAIQLDLGALWQR